MRADLGKAYDATVTILNRLDARDAGLKADAYYKTVLRGCMLDRTTTSSVQADGTVSIGTLHRLQIPESADYMPYREWSQTDMRGLFFTLREGDYVIAGEVDEVVTAENVKKVVASYEPDAFQIQHWRDLTKRAGLFHSVRGPLRFAECYYVEG